MGMGVQSFSCVKHYAELNETLLKHSEKKSMRKFEENPFGSFRIMVTVFTVSWSRVQDVCVPESWPGLEPEYSKALGVWYMKMKIGLMVLLSEVKQTKLQRADGHTTCFSCMFQAKSYRQLETVGI